VGHSVPEILGSIKRALSGDVYLILVITLVGIASFGLGRLSVAKEAREHIRIEGAPQAATIELGSVKETPATQTGSYVASRNGTKYHFPWCASASRILEENKVWFTTKEEAERAGYTPAANCEGL
jgi:hypothetical protein